MEFLSQIVVQHGPQVLGGCRIMLVSLVAAAVVRRSLARLLGRVSLETGVSRLVASSLGYVILGIGVLTGLNTMGVRMGPIIASLGLGGFALGFALKDAVSNLLAGIMILLYRPFAVGNRLAVSGCEGEVLEINLRYTVLRNGEETYMVPNSIIFTNPLRLKRDGESSHRAQSS